MDLRMEPLKKILRLLNAQLFKKMSFMNAYTLKNTIFFNVHKFTLKNLIL